MKRIVCLLLAVVGSIFAFNYGTQKVVFADSVLDVEAKSSYLMEASSGECVFCKNENERLPIASMTKIMLLNLIFESVDNGLLNLDESIVVSDNASGMGGSQVFLQANGEYKCADLVKGIIVASGNDCSVAMSERLFGSEETCVDKMNQKAKEWGLYNTLFSNVTGLTRPTQYSSARDVAIMFSHLVTHKEYFDYSNIWLDEIVHPDGQKTTITNTNKLVKFYDGCDGGKTGFTNEAKFCLAGTAKRGNMRVIAVVIGEDNSKQRFEDVKKEFNYCFNNYECKLILKKDVCLDEKLNIVGGDVESVDIFPVSDLYGFINKGDKGDFAYSIEFDEIKAPIKKGDKIGTITLYKNSVECNRVDLTINQDVKKASYFDCINKIYKHW